MGTRSLQQQQGRQTQIWRAWAHSCAAVLQMVHQLLCWAQFIHLCKRMISLSVSLPARTCKLPKSLCPKALFGCSTGWYVLRSPVSRFWAGADLTLSSQAENLCTISLCAIPLYAQPGVSDQFHRTATSPARHCIQESSAYLSCMCDNLP